MDRPPVPRRCGPLLLASSLLLGALAATPGQAQQAGYGQTLGTDQQQRQLLDGGSSPSAGGGGSILDSTNPIDLMNKIRRATAMDDATPPGSAIDRALKEFEAQAAPVASPVSPRLAP